MAKLKRQSQECTGCGDHFTTYRNYDYCKDCAVNGHRYVSNRNCSECDGLGVIKFRGQKPRPCKLCHLTKNPMNKKLKNLTIWQAIDQQTHALIADILGQTLPLTNVRKNFNPQEDADYRSLLTDYEEQLADLTPPELRLRLKTNHPEPLPEQIAYDYLLLVIKSLVGRLREFGCHDDNYLYF